MEEANKGPMSVAEKKLLIEYLKRRQNHKALHELPEKDKDALGQIILLIGYSEHSDETTHNEDYETILGLLRKSRDEKDIDPALRSIYEKRLAQTIATYQGCKDGLFKKILGAKHSQYQYLVTQQGKEEVAEQIRKSRFEHPDNKTLVEQYAGIVNSLVILTDWAIQFKPEHLATVIGNDPDEVLRAYASIIENPARQSVHMHMIEPEYEHFPLKWLSMTLPVPVFRKIYRQFKVGETLDNFILQYVEESLPSLHKRFDEHYFPAFTERIGMLHDSLHSYENNRYAACICTCLPLIEGCILKFADYYHRVTGSLFDYKDGKKLLRLSNGTLHKDFTIGDLLKRSTLSTFFDKAFIDYFCDELYNERNPILHGQDVSNFTQLNAAKKVMTFSYVTEVMDDFMKQQYFDGMDKLFSDELFEKFINQLPITDDDRTQVKQRIEQQSKKRPSQ